MIHDETVVVETKWFPFGKSEGEYKLDQMRIRTPEYDCEINIGQMKKMDTRIHQQKESQADRAEKPAQVSCCMV